jgi:hypothetical protein
MDMSKMTPKDRENFKDPIWRISNLYFIVDKNGVYRKFVPNKAQLFALKVKLLYKRLIIVKSRQLGISTVFAIYALDRMWSEMSFSGVFIAHQRQEASNLFKNKILAVWNSCKMQSIYEIKNANDGELRIGFGIDKKTGQSFAPLTESYIRVVTSGRSGTYRFAHISEMAAMEEAEPASVKEMISGTIPATAINSEVVIESTARAPDDTFSEMFNEAWEREHTHQREPVLAEYKALFLNWQYDTEEIEQITPAMIVPLNQMSNRQFFEARQLKYNLTPQELTYYYSKYISLNKSEYELKTQYPLIPEDCFEVAGERFFDTALMDMHKPRNDMRSEPQRLDDAKWQVFMPPARNHIYVCGADPAGGEGGDLATLCILDVTTGEQVAEFACNNTPPDKLGEIAVRWCKKYNNALLIPESNNQGLAFIYAVRDIYAHLYVQEHYDTESGEEKEKIGMQMDKRTKPLILYHLKDCVENFTIRVYSRQVLKEMKNYPKDNVNLQRMMVDNKKSHYDRLMALALACWGMTQAPKRRSFKTAQSSEY